jgi:hypothetical protein
MYLDRMLSGPDGGPRNTDGWVRADAQAELDAIPDVTVARLRALREVRNLLVHDSEEAKRRLREVLDDLACLDDRFVFRQAVTRRMVLTWLLGNDAGRLRPLAEAVLESWRSMIVAESVLLTAASAEPS